VTGRPDRVVVRPQRLTRVCRLAAGLLFVVFTIVAVSLRAGGGAGIFGLADQVAMVVLGAMAAGAVLFRERISRAGLVAIGLATVGVVLQGVATGHLPLIALFLAGAFWIYGIIRKQIDTEAQSGLFVECLFILIPGIAYAVWLGHTGSGIFGRTPQGTLLMMLAGPVTVAPLALFSWTARRLPLSLVAFLQFISPTMGFVIGAWLGEPLSLLRLMSFGFIWAGAAVFAAGAWAEVRRRRLD